MTKGAFKHIKHLHAFKHEDGLTVMTDEFDFSSPYGIIGKLFDKYVLKNYLEKLLIKRNQTIKLYAETELWKDVLH